MNVFKLSLLLMELSTSTGYPENQPPENLRVNYEPYGFSMLLREHLYEPAYNLPNYEASLFHSHFHKRERSGYRLQTDYYGFNEPSYNPLTIAKLRPFALTEVTYKSRYIKIPYQQYTETTAHTLSINHSIKGQKRLYVTTMGQCESQSYKRYLWKVDTQGVWFNVYCYKSIWGSAKYATPSTNKGLLFLINALKSNEIVEIVALYEDESSYEMNISPYHNYDEAYNQVLRFWTLDFEKVWAQAGLDAL